MCVCISKCIYHTASFSERIFTQSVIMSAQDILLRGVSVSLATESELEIANNNIPAATKRSYTVLIRRRSLIPRSDNDTSDDVISDDINGNSFKKPRIDAGGDNKTGEHGVEDGGESRESEEIFFDALEDINDDDTGDSEAGDVILSDYPHLNNFPELEGDGDVEEDVEEDPHQPSQEQSQEDLHNTSNTTLRPPEFSDHQWSQSQRTSELDLIIYSDRTSSEFIPDPRVCVRNEPMPTIWDIET